MAAGPAASVIVVSRGRPGHLAALLSALRWQEMPAQIVVVAPAAEMPPAAPVPFDAVPFDQANIALARNAGLAVAHGALVAFCDDDAIPEPGWLAALAAPFSDPDIGPALGAAGGLTRGRNGISLQWGPMAVDRTGEDHPLAMPDAAALLDAGPGRVLKCVGTSCIFRADALRALGGFDPGFAFYLDDADICLRLADAGWKLAFVPGAQVHHGFAASARRSAHRVPRDLSQVGFSKALFCRKHAPGQIIPALAAFRRAQARRLDRLLLLGWIGPAALRALLAGLDRGIEAGSRAELHQPQARPAPEPAFDLATLPQAGGAPPPHVLLAGGWRDGGQLRTLAVALTGAGVMVTLLVLSPTPAYLQAGFDPAGHWLHRGGLFGRGARTDPPLRLTTLAARTRAEAARLAAIRPVDHAIVLRRGDFTPPAGPWALALAPLAGLRSVWQDT